MFNSSQIYIKEQYRIIYPSKIRADLNSARVHVQADRKKAHKGADSISFIIKIKQGLLVLFSFYKIHPPFDMKHDI